MLQTEQNYPQIACRRRTDVGCWSQGRQILPTLGQRLSANHNSGYISLHFADVGPTLGQRWIFIQDGGEQ